LNVCLLISVAAISLSAGGVDAVGNGVDVPTIHYTFDSDLLDLKNKSTLTVAGACPISDGPCNVSGEFGEDSNGKYWTWTSTDARGGGFTVETNSVIGDSYTIALKFSFSDVTGYRKIIDYKDRASDNGFYYLNSDLLFYPYTSQRSATSYPADTVLDLVAVRTATGANTGTFTVYAVGSDNQLTQIFEANDTNNDSVPHVFGSPAKTRLGFFFDDLDTSSEATASGKVYDLRIWENTSLSATALSSQILKPAAPTQVSAVPGASSVTVSWQAVDGAVTYIATAGGKTCTVSAPATSCTITGLSDGQQVTPTVQAFSPGGESPITSAASAVTIPIATSTTTVAPTTTTTTTTTVAPTTTTTTTTTVASSTLAKTRISTPNELPATGTDIVRVLLASCLLIFGFALRKRLIGSQH
jgi:hypothetical protein